MESLIIRKSVHPLRVREQGQEDCEIIEIGMQ